MLQLAASVGQAKAGSPGLIHRLLGRSGEADRRTLIQDAEKRTKQLIEHCVSECVQGGFMREVDEFLFAYQVVMFCHAWALKNWALRDRYSLGEYVSRGIGLMVELRRTPGLSPRGVQTRQVILRGGSKNAPDHGVTVSIGADRAGADRNAPKPAQSAIVICSPLLRRFALRGPKLRSAGACRSHALATPFH